MKKIIFTLTVLLASSTSSFAVATALQRNIQFTQVNFENSTITLTNLSTSTIALDSWRFCSHDEDQVLRYSGSTGLNGQSLLAGGTLTLHFLNDATGDGLNISALGAFATTLDQGAYSISLYDGGSFGNGNNIVDHIQWSIDGVDNTSADERSDEAQAGGVWADQSSWISTAADSSAIVLNNLDGSNVLSTVSDYTVIPEPSSILLAGLGLLGLLRRRR